MLKKQAILIMSGGLDSTVLLYYLIKKKYKINAISFNYGQKHNKELGMAKDTCKKLEINHEIIDISSYGDITKSALTKNNIDIPEGHYKNETMKSTVVPNRNMIMLAYGATYAILTGARFLFYGAHSGDHAIYPDCRPAFVASMQTVLLKSDYHEVILNTPFLYKNKIEIVKIGKYLGVAFSLTWTCYKGEEKACGKCGACVERLEAFKLNNMIDPIQYQ